MTKNTKLPREVTNALQEADTAYIITTQGDAVEAFLIGQGCQCCQTDDIIEAALQIMQPEAINPDQPQIFTAILETVNHENGRQN